MGSKTKRVEVLFEPKEYKLIKKKAKSQKVSLGEFIRSAVRSVVESDADEKKRALEELISGDFAIDLPDWDEVEKIIEDGHVPCGFDTDK